jgi:hypothetical protein
MHGLSNFQKRRLKEGVHLEDEVLDGKTILPWGLIEILLEGVV